MEEATNQTPEAMEALISKIFMNISSLKSAYIQLQAAHTPYEPDKIQAADKLVISELKNLSELKHFYREKNPKPICSVEENGFFPVDLTPDLFISVVEAAFKAIHDFSKPLINMMKAAGWDLDAAANSIEPNVVYAKRAHKKYAFESHICQRMFSGFQHESFSIKSDNLTRNYVMGGGHPRTPFYQAFLKLAKSIWLLHRLAYSFDPNVKVFQVKRGSEFSEVYMESVVKNLVMDESDEKPKVGLMVMPGFWIGGSVIQCRVYLSGMRFILCKACEYIKFCFLSDSL
ncbi:unnamed protein product, partial [Vitis vinifera]